jgi:RsiW-degrading membrane proteinase PrsW (M82 family)
MLLAGLGSAIPVALWLAFFYTRDRFEREPKKLIAGLFAIGAVPVALLAGVTTAVLAALVGSALAITLLGPVGEEVLKYLGLRVPARRSRSFDEPIDGMIYGSTVGLGFAFSENIDYLVAGVRGTAVLSDVPLCEPGIECFLAVALVRGTGTALMHALSTGIAGFYLGKRVLANRPLRVEWRGVAYATLVHIGWNAGFRFPAIAAAAAWYAVLARRALAASPHRLRELDDSHHWIEHFAVGAGLLQPCPSCTHLHHPGQRFCSVCGFRLRESGELRSARCGQCGEPQPAAARFCSACGAPVRAGTEEGT